MFTGNKPVPVQASGRIQRWTLTLVSFEYTLEFRTTSQHSNADALSRLLLPEAPTEVPTPAELILLIQHLEETTVTASQIRHWTLHSPILSDTCKKGGRKKLMTKTLNHFGRDAQDYLSLMTASYGAIESTYLNKDKSMF